MMRGCMGRHEFAWGSHWQTIGFAHWIGLVTLEDLGLGVSKGPLMSRLLI